MGLSYAEFVACSIFFVLLSIKFLSIVSYFQLHNKFDTLKRQHADDKKRLEDTKKQLELEIAEFKQRKAFTEQQNSSTTTLSKHKKK